MGVSINLGAGRGKRWELDLSSLPVERVQKGSALFGLSIILFALVWGGLPLVGLITELQAGRLEEKSLFFLMFPAIGVGILLFGIHNLLWRRAVAFDGRTFTVSERGLTGGKEWREPLSAYQGVLMHSRRVKTKNSSYTLYLVDLVHPDSARNINLFTDTSGANHRRKWEDYARQLDVPALEEGAGGMVRREAGDLDKSVGELIDEGKVDIDYASLAGGAEGVAVAFEGDVTVVTRTGSAMPWWSKLLGLTFPLIFVGVALFVEDLDLFGRVVMGGVGGLFEIVFLVGVVTDLLSRQRLRIGPAWVWVNKAYARSETEGERIGASEIETVKLVKCRNGVGNAVEIASDHQKVTFGGGLPRPTLDFVMNTILAKIKETRRYRR